MADNVQTSDGMAVGRNVDAGSDFIGHDQITNNNYTALDDSQKLDLLLRRVIGDPLAGVVGIVESIEQLRNDMARRIDRQDERQTRQEDRQTSLRDELRENRQEVDARLTVLFFWLAIVTIAEVALITVGLPYFFAR